MKNYLYIIVFTLIFSGCTEISSVVQNGNNHSNQNQVLNKNISNGKIRNEKCMASDKLKVIQVLDNGALAHLCYDGYDHYGCNGEYDLVFLSVDSRDNDLVDDQKIVLPEDKCFLAIGRFFYESKIGRKVVRKVKIENAYTDGDLNKIN